MSPNSLGLFGMLIKSFQDALRTTADALYPWVLGVLGLLLLLELTRVFWDMTVHDHRGSVLVSFGIRFALLTYLIPRFEYYFTSAITLGVTLGLRVAGDRMTMGNFLAPGAYLEQGITLGQVLFDQWNKSTLATMWDIALSPAMTLTYFFAWVTFMLAFFLMALVIFMVQIEAAFALPLLLALTPFLAFSKTAWIGQGVVTYLVKLAYKFFTLALIASVVYPVVNTLTLLQEPDIRQAILMMFTAITFACCFLFGPLMARNMLSGVFTMGVGALAQTVLLGTQALVSATHVGREVGTRVYNLTSSVANEASGGRINLPPIAPVASRGEILQSLRDGARHGGHE